MHPARPQVSRPVLKGLRSFPRLRAAARWLLEHAPLSGRLRENLRQWLLRSVHEADFTLFDLLHDQPGLMLDIGANRGPTAISVLRRAMKFRVLSLEPNSELRWSLGLLVLLHPWRFRFRLLAAGDQAGTAKLIIPVAAQDLSSQASLDPREFDKPYVRQRLAGEGHRGGEGAFKQRTVKVCTVDSLGVAPDIVKIDVEGWERQVLLGMEGLLTGSRPVLIIEQNDPHRWAPFLVQHGYRFHTFERGRLVRHQRWQDVPGLNVICCHPGCSSPVARRLLGGGAEPPGVSALN